MRYKNDASGRPSEVAAWSWPGHTFIGNRQAKDGSSGRGFYLYAPLTAASAKEQGLAPASGQDKAKAAAPAAGAGASYKVKRGDSLSRIAKRYGVTEEALSAANPGLTDKNLKADATIALPQGANQTPDTAWGKSAAAPSGSYSEYTVKEGDILSRVANNHGARTRDVIAANPGIDPDNLKPGSVLKIPGQAKQEQEPASGAAQ